MKYVKPEIRKITADELKKIIVANADSKGTPQKKGFCC